jgi:cbb3-type cytochrome oxidase subunit 3
MRLTWKDGLTFLLLVAVGLVYYAYSTGADIAVINDTRGALVVLGVTGLGMCIIGGSSGIVGRNTYTGFMSVLGVAALALFLIGLVTTAGWTVTWLAIDIVVMWGLALVFRVFLVPAHGPTHA